MKTFIKAVLLSIILVTVISVVSIESYFIYNNIFKQKQHIPHTYNNGGYINTNNHKRPDFIDTDLFLTDTKSGLKIGAKLGSQVISTKDGKAYLLISLEGEELIENNLKERPPINIGIVIDKSGSMSGQKISYVKEALKDISAMFSLNDRVTLITYDDYVDIAYTSKIFNQDEFLNEVDKIYTGGSTNLEGGLRKGIDSVDELIKENSINKVILLSDGLANIGVSDSEILSAMVSDLISNDIVVSTIGVGVDYDDVLMSSIAIAGNGNYYFLENPIDANKIFMSELNTSMTTIAKNIKVKFNTEDEFQVVEGIGYKLDNQNEFYPNNIYAGKTSMYLFEIDADQLNYSTKKSLMMTLEVSCDSVQSNSRENIYLKIYTDVTKKHIDPLSDDEVYYEYINGQVGSQLWNVYEYLDQNDNKYATKEISDLISLLENANDRLYGVFDEDIDSLKVKQIYVEGLGNSYINDSSSGRGFQKSNQVDSYQKVYNK